jgi:magnesium-transporting ATPase (P-type)
VKRFFLLVIIFENGYLNQVGSLTHHNETQCFSTHLTKFTSGFNVLPEPINWNYVFVNADFLKNKTIYLTVIVVTLVYIILLVYARFYDRKDFQKVCQGQLERSWLILSSWVSRPCLTITQRINISTKSLFSRVNEVMREPNRT